MSLGREGVAYTLGGSAFGGAVKPVEGESTHLVAIDALPA